MSLVSINFLHLKVSRDIARTRFYRSRSLWQGQRPNPGQIPTPHGFQDIARTRFYRSRSLQQGQRSNQRQTMTLHTYTPNQCPY